MGTIVTGTVLGIEERIAGREPETWLETVIVVVDGTHVDRIVKAPDSERFTFRGALPSQGEKVALECGIRAYSPKSGGRAGYQLTAFGRNADVEAVLNEPALAGKH